MYVPALTLLVGLWQRGLVPGTRPPVTVVTLASNISEVIDGAVEAGQRCVTRQLSAVFPQHG
jgi:hypothetical protein